METIFDKEITLGLEFVVKFYKKKIKLEAT